MILGNPRRRVADEANIAAFQIGEPADHIEDLAIRRGIERVDRKIAPFGIGLPIIAEGHEGTAAVRFNISPQGRDFEGFSVDDERHRPMRDARWHRLDTSGSSPFDDSLGEQRRGNIDIGNRKSQQAVAHCSANDTPLAAIGVQQRQHPLQRPVLEPGFTGHRGHE